jgi:hypothetical protein
MLVQHRAPTLIFHRTTDLPTQQAHGSLVPDARRFVGMPCSMAVFAISSIVSFRSGSVCSDVHAVCSTATICFNDDGMVAW